MGGLIEGMYVNNYAQYLGSPKYTNLSFVISISYETDAFPKFLRFIWLYEDF